MKLTESQYLQLKLDATNKRNEIANLNAIESMTGMTVWHSIIDKCYNPESPQFPSYGGLGATVCDEWLIANNFVHWYKKHSYKPNEEVVMNAEMLSGERIIFSPQTCIFLPSKVNRMLINTRSARGYTKEGTRDNPRYVVRLRLSTDDKSAMVTHIGSFQTAEEAVKVYKTKKKEVILSALKGYGTRIPTETCDLIRSLDPERMFYSTAVTFSVSM